MNFTKLLIGICCVVSASCGGGGGGGGGGEPDPVLSGTVRSFPDVTLVQSVPRLPIATVDSDYHEYQELRFTFFSNGYFAQNPTGHAGIVMRSCICLYQREVWGIGAVFGNVSEAWNPIPGNAATQGNPVYPSVQIETWFGTNDNGNFLLAGMSAAPILKDNVDYDVIIKSHVKQDKSIQTVRIIVSQAGVVIYDTGLINDLSLYVNTTYNDVWAAHVFENPNAMPWEINYKNIKLIY